MWKNVGNTRFSAGEADYTSLAFDSTGQPYVAYADVAYSGKATVMKFDGTNWQNVGNAGFSAGQALDERLAFSPSGEPYVAFQEWLDYNFKATVMKFNGINWAYIGNAGFSAGEADYLSFAFSPTGKPYVAYEDCVQECGATVMKYDSVMVGINERKKLKLSIYPNPSSDQITIETLVEPAQSQLSISNLNGQTLITRQLAQPKTQLDISSLPSGVYFVRLTSDKTVTTGKFIKQ